MRKYNKVLSSPVFSAYTKAKWKWLRWANYHPRLSHNPPPDYPTRSALVFNLDPVDSHG